MEKRKRLIDLSTKYDFYIIEDDFLTDLSYGDKKLPLKSMDNLDTVIYIKSFSKIFMPGVRIGFMTVPKKLFANIIKAKHTTDISSSGFFQRAFDLYLRKGLWKTHIETIRKVYFEKYNTMVKELKRLNKYGISFTEPKGGLSIWIRLPENIDSIDLYKECIEDGLSIVPGKIFFIDDSLYTNYIRLSFGAASKEEIVAGIQIIENCLKKRQKKENSKYLPFI